MNSRPEDYDDDEMEQEHRPPIYAPMSVSKFIVLYIVTFGLYGILWQYRNWRYVKERDDSDIWPWARAIFIAPIWYYTLLVDIREEEGAKLSGWLAAAYFFFWVSSGRGSLLGLFGWVPLVPALSFINDINEEYQTDPPPYATWRKRNAFAFVLGCLLIPLAVFDYVAPDTRVLPGSSVKQYNISFLQEIGLVDGRDDVLYFYSPGFASVRGEGVVLTPSGIGFYWTDPELGGLDQEMVLCEEIEAATATWSARWYEDSEIEIELKYGSGFAFGLSPEAGGDRKFVTRLREVCELPQ